MDMSKDMQMSDRAQHLDNRRFPAFLISTDFEHFALFPFPPQNSAAARGSSLVLRVGIITIVILCL